MLKGKPRQEWIDQYDKSHQHPLNQLCHFIGIPLILFSLILLLFLIFNPLLWRVSFLMFMLGWAFQFAGHWIEGSRPEFLNDWRFLFVGLWWWLAKLLQR